MKVKFNTRFYDRISGAYYEPSESFVEVPNHVVERLRERAKTYKGEFEEYDEPKPVKKPVKPKLSE